MAKWKKNRIYLYPIPTTYNLVLNVAWHCSTVGLVIKANDYESQSYCWKSRRGQSQLINWHELTIKLTPWLVTMCSKWCWSTYFQLVKTFSQSLSMVGPSKVWILEGDKKCADSGRFYPGSACGAVIWSIEWSHFLRVTWYEAGY